MEHPVAVAELDAPEALPRAFPAHGPNLQNNPHSDTAAAITNNKNTNHDNKNNNQNKNYHGNTSKNIIISLTAHKTMQTKGI